MKTPFVVSDLQRLLSENEHDSIRALCSSGHPGLIAEVVAGLNPSEAALVVAMIEPRRSAEIFGYLPEELQLELVELLRRRVFSQIISHMSPDERADLLQELPPEKREVLLPGLAQAEREDIRKLASYREGTTGAVMTSDYTTLSPNLTVEDAIQKLRREAPDKETIYYAYVISTDRKLLGFVSLKDLILANPVLRVDRIMHREIIYAHVDDDQEETAQKIANYDLLALPVINGQGVLVGIVTHDDAIDIIHQEHTEDMEKFMAIGGGHEAEVYMQTSSWGHFKNRCVWIVILAFLGLVSGFIVQSFEGLLLQFTILATFMPMLADTGGNTGSQSATLVVRALAMKEITPSDVPRVLLKEFFVALPLGLLLATLAFWRVFLFAGNSKMPEGYSLLAVGTAVGVALGMQVVTSTLIGALLPLGAARLRLDPAVVASPALTTIVDITGLLIYFSIARLLLGI